MEIVVVILEIRLRSIQITPAEPILFDWYAPKTKKILAV